jgi:solute carrier family 25 carnitine/acylcarnitine transporter 20/29
MVREEGIGALFKGVAPALVRAFPANAACFLGMEASKSALDKLF